MMLEREVFMGRLLFTVGDRLHIRGRGVLVIPRPGSWHRDGIRVNDTVELRRPDGQVKRACITGFGHCPAGTEGLPLLLSGDLSAGDVPAGTEVWSD
jgi:hypothetical protein